MTACRQTAQATQSVIRDTEPSQAVIWGTAAQ